MSALRAAHLVVRYPGQARAAAALRDVDLTVEPGERLLLLGPNGAGKSTLLRIFAGLMRPTSGSAEVLGQQASHSRSAVGVMSHTTYLYDELTALENLRLYGLLYGVTRPERRAAELLSQVGLRQVADHRVGQLSRGQQQRVALARAVIHDPAVLLLDEPDTGLDRAAFDVLADLAVDPRRAVIMTTHVVGNGLRLGTRVAVLANGQIVHSQPHVGTDDAEELTAVLDRLARA